MSLKTNIAYIGIGSNLGDKTKNCVRAIQELHSRGDCKLLKISSFYETEPLTKQKQRDPWYTNAVLKLKTSLAAPKLLEVLLEVEKSIGRIRNDEKWEPRLIDLDLLFYNDQICKNALLTLPHPELHKRRFVLEPLVEIEPEWIHPVFQKTVRELYRQLGDAKTVIPLFKLYPTLLEEGGYESQKE